MSIWRSKNEPVELIIGNIMIAIGGFLIGYKFDDSSFFFTTFLAPIFIAMGIFFDVRVLKKFSYELKVVKDETDTATELLHLTMNDVDKHAQELTFAKEELRRAITEMQNHKKELKDIETKAFGFISRASSFQPLEKSIEELKRKIQELERRTGGLGRRY